MLDNPSDILHIPYIIYQEVKIPPSNTYNIPNESLWSTLLHTMIIMRSKSIMTENKYLKVYTLCLVWMAKNESKIFGICCLSWNVDGQSCTNGMLWHSITFFLSFDTNIILISFLQDQIWSSKHRLLKLLTGTISVLPISKSMFFLCSKF